MTEILIRTPGELDEGECAGKAVTVGVRGKPPIYGGEPQIRAVVSRRALRRLWADFASLWMWVRVDDSHAHITHIGASDYEREALDGAVIGGKSDATQ